MADSLYKAKWNTSIPLTGDVWVLLEGAVVKGVFESAEKAKEALLHVLNVSKQPDIRTGVFSVVFAKGAALLPTPTATSTAGRFA
jgi:hypothetical protein